MLNKGITVCISFHCTYFKSFRKITVDKGETSLVMFIKSTCNQNEFSDLFIINIAVVEKLSITISQNHGTK